MLLATSVRSRRRQVEPSVANAIYILPDDTNHKFICACVRFLTFIFKCCANVLSLRRITKRRWEMSCVTLRSAALRFSPILTVVMCAERPACHFWMGACVSHALCLLVGPNNLFTFKSQIFFFFSFWSSTV